MSLTLYQFEYAWEIHVNRIERVVTNQAYLRVAGIYYEEENFDFYSGKVASSLPYLQDKRIIVEEDQAIPYLKENV